MEISNQGFIVGNGDRLPNQGEMALKLEVETDGSKNQFDATFQVAQVTRPLMSVSKICDNDFTCHFFKDRAEVRNKAGKIVCTFIRRGGLYLCRMKLKSPFTGQGK